LRNDRGKTSGGIDAASGKREIQFPTEIATGTTSQKNKKPSVFGFKKSWKCTGGWGTPAGSVGVRRQTNPGRLLPAGSSRDERLDPFTLPVRFTAPDKTADGIGVFDVAQRKIVRVIKGGSDPENFDLSKDGSQLFISNEDDSAVSVVDIASSRFWRCTALHEAELTDRSGNGARPRAPGRHPEEGCRTRPLVGLAAVKLVTVK